MNTTESDCAQCPFKGSQRLCKVEGGKAPESCPTANKQDLIAESLEEYKKPSIAEFALQACIQEGEGYSGKDRGYDFVTPIKPRLQETIEFAGKMGYRKLGLAFCMGLRTEAKVVGALFASKGFEIVSCVCKAGRVPKEEIGLRDDQKIEPGAFESMCNPVFQAMVMNDAKTEFNIVMGLCVGHDSLFLSHATAPCTVLAVKDRVTGHNPLAAVYTLDSYYRSLK